MKLNNMKTTLLIITMFMCFAVNAQYHIQVDTTLRLNYQKNIVTIINTEPKGSDTLISPTTWNEIRRITNQHIRKLDELTTLIQQLQQRINSLEKHCCMTVTLTADTVDVVDGFPRTHIPDLNK
jgi:hypothetical protein